MPRWALLYVNVKHALELPRGHYQNDGTRTASVHSCLLSPRSISIANAIRSACHVVCLVITIETIAAMIIIMFYIVIGRTQTEAALK